MMPLGEPFVLFFCESGPEFYGLGTDSLLILEGELEGNLGYLLDVMLDLFVLLIANLNETLERVLPDLAVALL